MLLGQCQKTVSAPLPSLALRGRANHVYFSLALRERANHVYFLLAPVLARTKETIFIKFCEMRVYYVLFLHINYYFSFICTKQINLNQLLYASYLEINKYVRLSNRSNQEGYLATKV